MRNVISLLLITFLSLSLTGCASTTSASGQKVSKKAQKLFNEALDQYRKRQYQEALNTLEKALSKQDDFTDAYLLKGEIGMVTEEYLMAIEAFEAVLEIEENPEPTVYYNLGKAEFAEGLYEDAEATLSIVLEKDVAMEPFVKKVTKLHASAQFAKWAIQHPVPFNPQNLGEAVNTKESEYHPSVSLDEQTLILTRKFPQGTDRFGNTRYTEDFYYSRKVDGEWQPIKNVGPPLNTRDNEGAQSLSADGQYMYFTACHRPDGVGRCDLYRAKKIGKGWGEAENLGKPVNAQAWDSQPSISADGNTLYFTSSRSGGKGEKDIWVTVKDEEGNWGRPQNLPFNTEYNELSPFIHPDGKTLYFASDGHPGMGGQDIFFVTKQPDGSWSEPTNLGYPINTYNDEHGLIVNPKGTTAYFATDRIEGMGKLDILQFELYPEARPTPVVYVKGRVKGKQSGKGLSGTVQIIDRETEQLVATAQTDDNTGAYIAALPLKDDYVLNATSEGYLFHSETFELKEETDTKDFYELDIFMDPIEVGNSVVLKNIFFETGKYNLKPISKAELNKLVSFLTKNPSLIVEISGHTDNVGEKAANQQLSENRAKAVKEYLVSKGISEERLQYKGYGESKPIATNDTPEGRAKNRRTEFTVVGMKP